jgi:hypothetical protein
MTTSKAAEKLGHSYIAGGVVECCYMCSGKQFVNFWSSGHGSSLPGKLEALSSTPPVPPKQQYLKEKKRIHLPASPTPTHTSFQ